MGAGYALLVLQQTAVKARRCGPIVHGVRQSALLQHGMLHAGLGFAQASLQAFSPPATTWAATVVI